MIAKYIIFDLDGCISDDRRRLPLIDHSQDDPWAEYHAGCWGDPLMNEHYVVASRYFAPIIFTARPEAVRRQTREWLEDVAQMKPRWIFMRSNDDRASSVELKERFLSQCFIEHGLKPEDIFVALDDRTDILAMYRRYAIPVCQTKYPEEVTI